MILLHNNEKELQTYNFVTIIFSILQKSNLNFIEVNHTRSN